MNYKEYAAIHRETEESLADLLPEKFYKMSGEWAATVAAGMLTHSGSVPVIGSINPTNSWDIDHSLPLTSLDMRSRDFDFLCGDGEPVGDRYGIVRASDGEIAFRNTIDNARKRKDQHAATSEFYLSALRATKFLTSDKMERSMLKLGKPRPLIHSMQKGALEAWYRLRNAKIFHFDGSQVDEWYDDLCKAYISRHGNFPWTNGSDIDSLVATINQTKLPESFPFANVYCGFGSGVHMQIGDHLNFETKLLTRSGENGGNKLMTGRLMGALICNDGFVIQFYEVYLDNWERHLTYDVQGVPGGWVAGMSAAPMLAQELISTINTYKTYIMEEEPEGFKKSFGAARKDRVVGKKAIPPDFYVVRMEDKIVHRGAKKAPAGVTGHRASPSYRHDVRGHERVYIRRGKAPIDPIKRSVLESRGFTVYENQLPDGHIGHLLDRRSQNHKGMDEWVAIRIQWVKQHESPKNKDLPHVRSLHLVERKLTNTIKKED